jgi:predicted peptidase
MRARYRDAFGVLVAAAILVPVHAPAQTPAGQIAQAGQTGQAQTGRAGRGGQQTPQPQSPTFARIQARTYQFSDGASPIQMPYEVFVPTRYDPSRRTPLIVSLHGLGSNPTQVIRYQGFTDEAEARGYIIVAPMGYNSGGWYGSRGPGRAGRGGRGGASDEPENLGELSEKDVLNVLNMVRKEFNVDPARTYLFGHSMGGGGTYHIGIKYKDVWAALAPAAPAIYTSPDTLEAIRNIPIIVVQGDEDNLVDVNVTRRWIEKMKSLGMKHEYIEVAGGDHTRVISRSPGTVKRIFDFFDAARKQ